jgi:hypothetical protein
MSAPKRGKPAALRVVRANDVDRRSGLGPEDRERWTRDPRTEDLPEDSLLWDYLLQASFDFDAGSADGLFGCLHGLRCLGARLERALWGIRLVPGELGRGQYSALRQRYLMPQAEVLEGLLAELGEAYPGAERSA